MITITRNSDDMVEVAVQRSSAQLFIQTLRDYCSSGTNEYIITAVPSSPIDCICFSHSGDKIHIWISGRNELIMTGSLDHIRYIDSSLETALEEGRDSLMLSHAAARDVIAEDAISVKFSFI